MSEYRPDLTIPTDSLVVSRKVRTGSRANIAHRVTAAITATGLENSPKTSFGEVKKIAVDLIGRDEYIDRKRVHPVLGTWSPIKLADAFNEDVQGKSESVNDYVEGAELGHVDFDEIDEGFFIIGFYFRDNFMPQLANDRADVVDTLLDVSGTSLTDPIRNWRNEGVDELWLPVVTMRTKDLRADEIAQDFSQALEDATNEMAIDLYDAQARHVFVNVPMPN